MPFNIHEVVKVLGCFEKLISVLVCLFIRDTIVDNNIDTFVSIELIHLFEVNLALLDIHLIHDIENCGYLTGLEALYIHLVQWVATKEYATVLDLLVEELIQEVTIGFVHPTVHNKHFV